ncbi:MAG TPA: histidinol-phosphatase HisJ family protein [Thermoanaerobaculia bacterium]|nr:histidinol-phosphatase HisJ family protein [Thermoanaerobaculia bacterium]
MLTDYHTHTFRCGHAVGTLRDYVESAMSRGIGEIGLTDHLYLYFLAPEKRDLRWAMPEDQYRGHYEEMLAVREEYRGRINVRVSVEADYVRGSEEMLDEVLSGYSFDYVMGSVHFMDDWLIDDPDQAHRYGQQDVTSIYRRYYERLREAVELDEFDLLAHFDLPKKFGFLPDADLTPLIAETLDAVRDHDIAIEVSTAGLRKPVGEIYPSLEILRAMNTREIPISLSSDAHDPTEVGAGYDQSIALVRSVGYVSLAVFDQRERRQVPLG